MKKETILTIVVCVLVVVSVLGNFVFAYILVQESGECLSCASPRYLVYECSNETANWTSIEYSYGNGYPDSYSISWSYRNITTGQVYPVTTTYCELTWNFDPIIIQDEP